MFYFGGLAALILLVGKALSQQCKAWPSETSSWPTAEQWATLNTTVSGQLITGVPPAAVCHRTFKGANTYDQAQCRTVTNSWGNQEFHINHPTSILWDFWTNRTCTTTTNPDSPCTIGTYPEYVLRAQKPEDVQAGINFARERNVRL